MHRLPKSLSYQSRIFTITLAIVIYSAGAMAECGQWAAKLASAQGIVEAISGSNDGWEKANMNDEFCPGDKIRVGKNSRANLRLASGAVMRINENSVITVQAAQKKGNSLIDMVKGAAHFFSRKPSSLKVNTPYAIAGVRGTEFLIRIDEDRSFISVFEGAVVALNDVGELALGSGQSAEVENGKAPELVATVRPRDAVSWALFYPRIYEGDDKLVAEASELLSVGKTKEAEAKLGPALSKGSDEANALMAIISVVNNDKEKAREYAQKALATEPTTATPFISSSYVKQAYFDIEGARSDLKSAVRVEPGNALAHARLAEVHAMLGDLSSSEVSAAIARELAPNLSRTQTVAGFSSLMLTKTAAAKNAFTKAIELDQADPLPRLGLGLALIREGELDAGAEQIEMAASLDPNNALIRSYLGKAYYEQKRGDLDAREYSVAKELDPNDPTPWFYEAVKLQTANRPVESMRSYQQAKKLNDNRAVYRSKLLLDSDEAARSAALARVYGELGFDQLALVEGWGAVNADPSNHSAHRFLADSYSGRERHEIARVSELLQSQLLQPTNKIAIQPRQAESNLFLISAQGSAGASHNEFNPLFTGDGLALQASTMFGSEDTRLAEAIASGVVGRFSFSAGYSTYNTEGFRKNNDQEDDAYNLFAQYEFTPSTSLQLEHRYRDVEKGDLTMTIFEDAFSPLLDEQTTTENYRVGLRHKSSQNSTFLASYIYQELDGKAHNEIPPVVQSFDIELDQKAHTGELQHIFRSGVSPSDEGFFRGFNATLGLGRVVTDAEQKVVTVMNMPPPPPPPMGPGGPGGLVTNVLNTEPDVNHTNVYLYSNIKVPSDLTITLGVSRDYFEETEGVGDIDQTNPKFGLTWNPFPATTLRAAYFKVLKRTLVTDQTLEPTQVAGFNQFYDDANATKSKRYGVGVDQSFGDNLFAGIEWSKRELDVPVLVQDIFGTYYEWPEWEERLARSYIFWTPHEWLAFRAELELERFDREMKAVPQFKKLENRSIKLGAEFDHPCGLSASVAGTFFKQEGEFYIPGPPPPVYEEKDVDFWMWDMALKYRLPKRNGFIVAGVNNIFDEDSAYQSIDLDNPSFRPDRLVYVSLTLSLN